MWSDAKKTDHTALAITHANLNENQALVTGS